jgi:prolyl oligopeptidase
MLSDLIVSTKAILWLTLLGGVITATLGVAQSPDNETSTRKVSDVTLDEDPYLWLEDVTAERALNWVREKNAQIKETYESREEFTDLREDLLAILDSDERIPFVSKHGDYYYNFWRDQEHERGLWRRTTLEEYRKQEPEWETLLDLDALADEEGENWVWKGSQLLRPDYDRALIDLSRGGADATVTREFDLTTGEFIEEGFFRPEAKGGLDWIDHDNVFVYTDFGEGTLTSSGYPRIVKWWKRGTPMEQAEVVYEGKTEDMYISATHDDSPGYERDFVSRTLAFYNDELYLRTDAGELRQIDVPNSANKSVFHDYLIVELREPWEMEGASFPAGALLITNFDEFMDGKREFEAVFEPTERTSLAGYSPTRDYMLLNVLEDVKNRIYVLEPSDEGWRRPELVGAPAIGTVGVRPVDADESNDYWMTVSGYLTPTTLAYGVIGEAPSELKQLPHQFDASGLEVTQHFATSQDGTRVPYFMVAKEGLELDGSHPTLLYGYGGFEISLTPGYNATAGRAWTSQGGVYVVANIRGGGEYGPRWHQAALKQNRLRAYEDFAAVAEDLIARGVTSRQRLGIQGGSNGGLLVGNMVTIYPDLFKAAVCQVPLLDMKRYHLLLAGASWMAEYGNPDDPDDWAFIKEYSPYQNVREDQPYPRVLFTTTTRDDRVHPGHARKMMAKMQAGGHDVYYYENIEGGHGGAANNKQRAYMTALAYTFLREQLFAYDQ